MPDESATARADWEASALAARAALGRIRPELLEAPTPNPGWDVRDLAAHIANNDVFTVKVGKRLSEGKPILPVPIPHVLVEKIGDFMNARAARKFRNAGPAQLARTFDEQHSKAVSMLDAVPPEGWTKAAWAPEFGAVTLAEFISKMAEHYREHTSDLENALANDDSDS